MLHYFKNSKNATETHKNICAVCREGAVTDWMYQKWFVKFCAGDVWLGDALWSGRPVEVDSDQIETLRIISIIPPDSQHTQNVQINKVINENE